MAKPSLDDYVDVAERIRQFKAAYPDGSLQTWAEPQIVQAGDKTFVMYAAAAFRTEHDDRPGVGWAWEPVPGPTPFTRDSELMNAETAAWGRAILALGDFAAKRIASRDEVVSAQNKNSLYDLKAKVFEKALEQGAKATAEGVAEHFGVTAEQLQDEEVLKSLLTSKPGD